MSKSGILKLTDGRKEMNIKGISKYKSVKTTVGSIVFHSKKEANRYLELKLLLRQKEIEDLVLQPKFKFALNGVNICSYIADFQYLDRTTGDIIVEDCKGFKTPMYRLKKKLLKAFHGIDVFET